MKNREAYKNALSGVQRGDLCGFIQSNILRKYGLCCPDIGCDECLGKMFEIWLDEEYEEPPKPEVDWSKVPVDTLVRVRDGEDEEWILRYFKGINEDSLRRRYEAWESGATSKTADDCTEYWKYCELAEEEDDEVLNKSDNCPFMEVEDGSN